MAKKHEVAVYEKAGIHKQNPCFALAKLIQELKSIHTNQNSSEIHPKFKKGKI